jgi:uncharacterized protein YndB with AHSA1/START domain
MTPIKIQKIGELEIEITRSFDAPRQMVFDCFIKPELLRKWMIGPDGWSFTECKVDLRVRGKFRFVWQNTEGLKMGVSGVYKEVRSPEKLVHTELVEPGPANAETVATLSLEEMNGKTFMRNSVRYQSNSLRDAAWNHNLEEGMAFGYHRLETLCLNFKA